MIFLPKYIEHFYGGSNVIHTQVYPADIIWVVYGRDGNYHNAHLTLSEYTNFVYSLRVDKVTDILR